jgi:hypothetical protein
VKGASELDKLRQGRQTVLGCGRDDFELVIDYKVLSAQHERLNLLACQLCDNGVDFCGRGDVEAT